jgi:spermidine/putrescine-binding protein
MVSEARSCSACDCGTRLKKSDSEGGTIEILNWADYTNPEVIADFEKAFGVTVKQSIYDNEDAAIAKLRNGTLKPDLIIGMTDTALARLMAGELIQPLNHSYIPNKANLLTGLQNPYYDLGAQYTMAQFIYGNGIGYRRDRIDPADLLHRVTTQCGTRHTSGKLGVPIHIVTSSALRCSKPESPM